MVVICHAVAFIVNCETPIIKEASACCAVLSLSIVFNPLRPRGLNPPGSSVHGDTPGKNTGVGLPCPPPGDLPNPGIKPRSPALQADSLPSEPPGKRTYLVKLHPGALYYSFLLPNNVYPIFNLYFQLILQLGSPFNKYDYSSQFNVIKIFLLLANSPY